MNFSRILKKGQGLQVEFTDFMSENGFKTISAFSNSEGGTLFCGVSDAGEIVGFDCNDQLVRTITHKIMDKMGIHPTFSCFDWDDKEILMIIVKKSPNPISYNGRYYKRANSITTPIPGDELKDFFLQGSNWDGLTNDYSVDEIDEESVGRFIRRAVNKGRLVADDTEDISEILLKLNLLVDGKLTNAALILFGKDPQKYFTNALVRVLRFKDEVNVSDRRIKGNLFRQAEEAEEAIKNSINVKLEIKGKLTRDEIWDYPLEAIREALINSIVHRDYFKYSIQSQIKIFDDHIWFFNPGELFGGITIEKLKNTHPSSTRNPLISEMFFKAGLVEVHGSGIQRMIRSLKGAGLPEPDFKEEFAGFSVYMKKNVFDKEYLKSLGLNNSQIQAIAYIQDHGSLTMSDFLRISHGINERTLRRYLADLVDKKLIRAIGEKKGRRYELF
ncbi:transcriptional regulator [Methanobacterium subterraneum]|uniref:Transcriptional regulator n=1 Tax=Methanobacterium subterraneum TaxID=59277 RepID=A0A2H4VEA1_9EURY|nr:ATP-binding protein [Methanobacterium subterraneum]AUB56370.1 transcriptional regulator [Methanobacterium subterraneum]